MGDPSSSPEGRSGYVLVVGPDGAGKSTVVDAIARRAAALGTDVTRGHYRPGLIAGRADAPEITDPHSRPARPMAVSALKLAAVFVDHMVGGPVRWRRRGLLVVERGWLDMAVDPRRYRLTASLSQTVRLLGRFVARPDVVLLLTGDAELLHARKPEIGVGEVSRQIDVWRELASTAGNRVIELDTVETAPEAAASAVFAALSAPTEPCRPWRHVPFTARRLALRSQGDSAPAQAVYQPFSRAARAGVAVGWRVGRLAGPTTTEPLRDLEELWRLVGLAPDGVVAMRSSAEDRLLFAAASRGRFEAVVKVGGPGDEALRREAALLGEPLRDGLPFRRPDVRWSGDWRDRFVLVTDPVQRASSRPWSLDEVVALVADLATAGPDGTPLVHGDLAPWNMVRTAGGPVLLDWEAARWADEPLHDLAHFVVQAGALLGRYTPQEAHAILCAEGRPGSLLLRSTGRSTSDASGMLAAYLEKARPTEPRARRFRNELINLVSMP